MSRRSFVFGLFLLVSVAGLGQQQKIKVYLLGTFHFAQTDTLTYDVRSEFHQKSIEKLVGIVTKLRPDKIFIERMPEWEKENKVDSFYQLYRGGAFRKARNEIWQVAAKAASRLGHVHLYQCDHPGQYSYFYSKLVKYATQHGQENKLAYNGLGMSTPPSRSENQDSLQKALSLLDFLRYLNSEKTQVATHASYINVYPQIGNTDVFNSDSTYFMGANLTADWYRRNIMIYSKMLAQLDYKEKAIFLIIGNDHIAIIRQLFSANPYFDVMQADKWL